MHMAKTFDELCGRTMSRSSVRRADRRAMVEHVTILGDGAMATVCSILLTQGGHQVTMWGAFEESVERLIQDREQHRLLPGVRVPSAVRLTANDADCFDGCTMTLSAVP